MSEIEKSYYTIKDTAEMFNLTPSKLRFWEKETALLNPFRNKRGVRYYTTKDMELIRTLYSLIEEKGYTIKGAVNAIKSNFSEESKESVIIDTLSKVKQLLLEIKQNL